jgi:hypothetical protein
MASSRDETDMMLDTNIMIYAAKPDGGYLQPWLENPEVIISIVSRIEAPGFPKITTAEKAAIESALRSMPEAGLTESIAGKAIALRQERKMGLANAILPRRRWCMICHWGTRNVDDFKHVAGLKLIDPFAPST